MVGEIEIRLMRTRNTGMGKEGRKSGLYRTSYKKIGPATPK